MFDIVGQLTKELRKKEMIITNFIPHSIVESLEKRTVYDEETDDWGLKVSDIDEKPALPPPGSARPNCRRAITEFARIKRALGMYILYYIVL